MILKMFYTIESCLAYYSPSMFIFPQGIPYLNIALFVHPWTEHLKLGLAAHEQYFQEFKREFTQRVQTVESQIEALQGGEFINPSSIIQ